MNENLNIRQLIESLAGCSNGGTGAGRGRPGPRISEFARVVGLSPVTVQSHADGRKKPGKAALQIYLAYSAGGKRLYNKMKKIRKSGEI